MEFTNGFTSWMETYHEVVAAITKTRLQEPEADNEINRTHKTDGTFGIYVLAERWTNEFEEKYKGRDWSDGSFFGTIEEFLTPKLSS